MAAAEVVTVYRQHRQWEATILLLSQEEASSPFVKIVGPAAKTLVPGALGTITFDAAGTPSFEAQR